MPPRITLREVGLRDGLQAESAILSLADKVALYQALVGAGLTRIEATSFVAAKAIPQLADAGQFLAAVGPHPDVWLSALAPNLTGAERAVAAGVDEVTVFLSASETHNRHNVRRSVQQSLSQAADIASALAGSQVVRSAVIATAFDCPYEGPQDAAKVAELARRLREMGYAPILFGDTIGAANPVTVSRLLEATERHLPVREIGLHFHNTRDSALANLLVGLEHGVTLFDAAVGGMGGCPYAPGATGNVASEDVVAMVEAMGITTGVDLAKVIAAAALAQDLVGRQLPSACLRAFDRVQGTWTAYGH
ncbi:MAG: hydroxymethylglutaryl-CoA lyase [Sulfobacillus sp.]